MMISSRLTFAPCGKVKGRHIGPDIIGLIRVQSNPSILDNSKVREEDKINVRSG